MSSPYTEHAEKWKALADIDYFTQFIKAWIPFNAWYMTYYPNLTTDRQAINEIKSTSNKFRDRLIALDGCRQRKQGFPIICLFASLRARKKVYL